jgi:cell division protease FtsH
MPQERGNYGDETAQKIDSEIKRILTDAHDKARQILTDHRDKLESVPYRLLEIEVMEGDELRELLGAPPPSEPATETIPLPPTMP